MVSVVSGSGLGVFGATAVKGSGAAGIGQGPDQVYVNSATGNLVIQSEDERLQGLGLSTAVTRVYNSQGLMDDDNGDNWRLGVYQRVGGLTGQLNTASSTVKKTFGDGREVLYRYDIGRGVYVSPEGPGAQDTLSNAAGQWTWTEGSSRSTETFDSNGRLLRSGDRDGNTVSYEYTGELLTRVTDASGQITSLEYQAGSRQLTQLRVASNGVVQTRTRYAYDGLNRLSEVKVDLTPADNTIADGNIFVTRYRYEGDSKRLASLTHSDGSTVSFSYELGSDGQYRVSSYTEGAASLGLTTTFSYSAARGVVAALGEAVSASAGEDALGARRLTNFVPEKEISVAQGEWRYYAITVPPGAGELSIVSAKGSGDAALYVRRGALPSLTEHEALADAGPGNDEMLYLTDPEAGVWYVGVYGHGAVTGLQLQGQAQSTAEIELTAGELVSGISGVSESVRQFRFTVPPGTQNIRVTLSGPNGDADLYVTENGPVDLGDPDYYSEGATTHEVLIPDVTTPGTWYVVVKGYERFSEAQLVVHLDLPAQAVPPSVLGGEAQAVSAGAPVALSAVAQGAGPLRYQWTQVAGPTVVLSNAGTANATFQAPRLSTAAQLRFAVQVSDAQGVTTRAFTQVSVDGTGNASVPPVNAGESLTRITDALGTVSTQVHDAQGRLIRVHGAVSRSDYVYDSDGHLTALIEDAEGAMRTTAFEYDAQGNLTLSRDAAGQTVRRVYDARNQLLSETRYQVADSDGAGAAQAAQPLTTRFVYGARDELRFTVSAEGRVSEFQYSATGLRTLSRTYAGSLYPVSGLAPQASLSLAQLTQWASAQPGSEMERVEYSYDFRGQLTSTATYGATLASGAGVPASVSKTQFIYSPRGLLLQTLTAAGGALSANPADPSLAHSSTYTYDGMDRLISTTQRLREGSLRTTLTRYDDAGYSVQTTLANGLVKTATYDSSGQLRGEVNASGVTALTETRYLYDAAGRRRRTVDGDGLVQHFVYDAAGRQVGEIAGDGRLTRFVYDRFDQLIQTVQYADRLSRAALASLSDAQGQPTQVSVETLIAGLPTTVGRSSDAITRTVRDEAGRAVYEIDAAGGVTQYVYNGAGWLTDQVQYARPVSIATSSAVLRPQEVARAIVSDPQDRHSRTFFSDDGVVRARLDAAGTLVEYLTDAAGHLRRQISHATAVAGSVRTHGTLEQVRAAADPDSRPNPEQDLIIDYFYDGHGQQVAVLDAGGYLSETLHDANGRVIEERRYDRALIERGTTLTSLKRQIDATTPVRSTLFAYDEAGQLIRQSDYQGTASRFTYDAVGQRITTTVAADSSEERSTQARYDVLGRVVQRLSGEGSALLTTGLSAAQIDSIWERYGERYEYTAGGQLKSLSTRPDDTQVNLTRYFYNADGQLSFEVNAQGEVQEKRYDALGRLEQSIAYTNRILTEGLSGGAITQTLLERVAAAVDLTQDARTYVSYTLTGQVKSTLKTGGSLTTLSYNAFGQVSSKFEKLDAERSLRTDYGYDARGLLTHTRLDPLGASQLTVQQYDAFGRATALSDARGNTTRLVYDTLGRVIETVDALSAHRFTTYDAFSRTLSTRDASGAETRFAYNDAERSTTVTTPHGIAVTTRINQHGQTLSVSAAGNVTQYEYDHDGQLTRVSDALGTLESHRYDRGARTLISIDARGVQTSFTYDVADRVLTQTVDAGGLAQLTRYRYDGQGRVSRVTAANGAITDITYDAAGRVSERVLDPQGLALRSRYEYDVAGHLITLTEGAGSPHSRVTRYGYDVLGQRIEEVLDPGPGKLNLTQQLRYDATGNLTRVIDALGNSLWYVYDAAQRRIQSIDASGAVTATAYDAEGRVSSTRAYATRVSTRDFGNGISAVAPQLSAQDRLEQSFYDAEGHVYLSVDTAGAVTQRSFDANGNVIRRRVLAKAIAVGVYASGAAVNAALIAAGNDPNTVAPADHVEYTAYDLRNNAAFTVDAAGAVARIERDAAGNVVRTTAFATLRDTALPTDLASLTQWAAHNAIATHPDNRVERFWYDALGRQAFHLDAAGYLKQTLYFDAERRTSTVLYHDGVTLPAGATLQQVRAHVVVVNFDPARDRVSTTEQDAAGRITLAYDALSFAQAPAVERYEYDAVGNRTATVDARGNITRRTFDPAGRELTLTTALGGVTTQTYNATGDLIKLQDARGFSGYRYYNALGQLTYQVDPAGYVTELTYDSFGNVVGERAYANALSGGYHDRSSLADIASRLSVDPARDRRLSRSFDARGLIKTITYHTATASYTEEFRYDTFGQKVEFKNRNGAVRNYGYDARGLQVSELGPPVEVVTSVFPSPVTQLMRLESRTQYDAFGAVTVRIEAAGTSAQRETRIFYDPLGREVRIQAPAFQVYDRASNTSTLRIPETLRTYDAAGNLIVEVGPNGARSVNYYDSRNLLRATVAPDGVLSEFEYDAVGNQTAQRIFGTPLTGSLDPNLKPTPVNPDDYRELTHQYNANNQRVLTATRAETLYSTALASRNGDGYYSAAVITLAEYDQNGQVIKTTDGNGNVVRHYYDAVGNEVLKVDEAGYVTHWQYNAQGQVTREIRLAGQLSKPFQDSLTPASVPASILAQLPAGEDRITVFTYDLLGRVIEERKLSVSYTTIDANTGRPTTLTADVVSGYQHDGNGNVLVQNRADGGRIDFTYDALDRKTSQLDPQFQAFLGRGQGLASVRSQQLFKYDAHGNEAQQLSLGSSAAENREVLQQFDPAGNVRQRSEAGGASFSYDYDLSGNTVRTTRPVRDVNGTLHQYRTYVSFDLAGREISRQDIADQGTAGEVIRETQDTLWNGYGEVRAKGVNGQFQESFLYDRLGRLFYSREKGAPTLFLYDANGNAVLKVKGVASDLSQVRVGGTLRAIRGPADIRAFSPETEQFTTSFYDERNLLVAVADAPMDFGTLLAAKPFVEGTRTAAPEALRAARESLPTALTLKNATGGTLAGLQNRTLDAEEPTTATGFGPAGTFNDDKPLDARSSAPPNFGRSAGQVISEPVVTLVSDSENDDHTVRTVVEDIRRTITTTTVEPQDKNGDGVFETLVKTVRTEQPVTRRTTSFTRTRTESVAQDEESLTGQASVTVKEETQTTGTVNVQIEEITRTRTTSKVTRPSYEGGLGVLNLVPSMPIKITISYLRRRSNTLPQPDEVLDIGIYVNGPNISAFGNSPTRVEAFGPFGVIRQEFQSSNKIEFFASRTGTYGDVALITISKGGYTLQSVESPGEQTVQLGPFVSLKQLPANAVSAQLRLLDESGGVQAGPIGSTFSVQDGSGREFIFAEPYPGAFAANQRYEYTLLDGSGAPINRVQGRLGSGSPSAQMTTTTSIFTLEAITNTMNQNGSIDQRDAVPQNDKQANYLLNLVRSITQGAQEEYIIKREQRHNAFREVTSQIDGRGFTTQLFYDKQGNLVRQEQPDTEIYPEFGAAFRGRPTTRYFYNQLSELVGTQDANSVALSAGAPYYSTRVLVNGRVEKEFNATGEVTRHVYDRLGEERQQFDALNQETAYRYDLAGRLVRQERFETDGTLHSSDSYQYDTAGNRTEHTNALGDTETYLYDDQNRIRRYTSFAGRQTGYDYTYLSGLNGIGGYEKVTTTAGINGLDTQLERTDLYGNLRYSRDLGNHEYYYEYNNAGLLSRQTGTTAAAGRNAQDIRYKYFLNGLIESIDDLGISSYSKFEYDRNGNRTGEIYSRVAIRAGVQDVHPYQVAYAQYDSLNRLVKIAEADRFDVSFTYDAVGNRRSVKSQYFDLLTGNHQRQEFYYKYDALNRFTVTLGELNAAGQIVSGTSGYDIAYDALDRRISATSRLLNQSTHTAQYVKEKYQYDRIGTVKRVEIYNEGGALLGGSARKNSVVGSLLKYTEFKVEQGSEVETRKVDYVYDRDQRVQSEITTTERNTSRRDRTEYFYDGDGILSSTFATTIDQNNSVLNAADRVTVSYAYEKWDSYKESTVNVTVGPANMRNWRMGTSRSTYDSNGHNAQLYDAQADRTIEYVTNQNGQVLKRYQIDRELRGGDKPAVVRSFYYLNGRGIGDTGNDRVDSRVDYAQQLAEQEKKDKKGRTSQINPQLGQRIQPVTSSDFDQNFQPINDSFPAKVAGTHIVQPNETLQSIALSMYGDSSLWYLIADANGITGNEQLVSGLRLTIPNVVSNVRNNAETFRPYDVEAALGDTRPTLPPPPPPPRGKKGCGVVATVLIAAVAIIATIASAGVAASAFSATITTATGGTVAAGTAAGGIFATGLAVTGGAGGALGLAAAVVGGAIGSIASQGVAIAAGLQKGFDFKGVALSAISAGVGAGLGGALASGALGKVGSTLGKLGSNPYTQAALRGAASSVLTQGISLATGLQSSFSWKQVAVAAVAAPVAQAFGNGAGALANSIGAGSNLGEFATRFSSGIGGSLVRKAFGSKTDSATLIADAFGSAVGESTVDGLATPAPAQRRLLPDQERARDLPETSVASIELATEGEPRANGIDFDDLTLLLSRTDASKLPGVTVSDSRATYNELLIYDALRSGSLPGFGKINGEDEASILARRLDGIIGNDLVRLNQVVRNANSDALLDSFGPTSLLADSAGAVANVGIKAISGLSTVGASLFGYDLAKSTFNRFQDLYFDTSSPLTNALGARLQPKIAELRQLSEEKLGTGITGVLGIGFETALDTATILPVFGAARTLVPELNLPVQAVRFRSPIYFELRPPNYTYTGQIFDSIKLRSAFEAKPTRILDANGNRIPFGFKNVEDFSEFTDALTNGLPEGTNIIFKGSAVTGRKFLTGKAFDEGRVSDFDIGLVNDDLFLKALDLGRLAGFKYKTSPNRIGPLTEDQLNILKLSDLRRSLSERAGRQVNFQLYESAKEALKKGDSIFVK